MASGLTYYDYIKQNNLRNDITDLFLAIGCAEIVNCYYPSHFEKNSKGEDVLVNDDKIMSVLTGYLIDDIKANTAHTDWGKKTKEILVNVLVQYFKEGSEELYSEDGVRNQESYEGVRVSYTEEQVNSLLKHFMEDAYEEEVSVTEEKNGFWTVFSNAVNLKGSLLPTYQGLFESGFEVERPFGLLCKDDDGVGSIASIGSIKGEKGSSSRGLIWERQTVAEKSMYESMSDMLELVETRDRSIDSVKKKLIEGYGGKVNYYFPMFLMQIAYNCDRLTVKSDNTVAFPEHTQVRSWGGYASILSEELTKLFKNLIYDYAKSISSDLTPGKSRLDPFDGQIKGFIEYCKSCLRNCILIPEYKIIGLASGEEELVSMKIRFSDPMGIASKLQGNDLLVDKALAGFFTELIDNAFGGSAGTEGEIVGHPIEVLSTTGQVMQFEHEFNHTLNNALPLFAYKAVDSIKKNKGSMPSWDNLILGKGSDGRIVKNAEGSSINYSGMLLHRMTAGSRAGKGVMTMNLLASAVASKKPIFYLDRKPDVSSMLKELALGMFLINGGGSHSDNYDKNGILGESAFSPYVKVCDEAKEVFGFDGTWYGEAGVGDFMYFRAMLFIMGMICARATGKGTELLGGNKGFVAVIDEFNNFTGAFTGLWDKALAYIPPMESAMEKVKNGKDEDGNFEKNFSNSGYYALSWVRSVMDSMVYLCNLINADFSTSELKNMDVFIIGQSLAVKPVSLGSQSIFRSFLDPVGRYRGAGYRGTAKEALGLIPSGASLVDAMVGFQKKFSDAFMGYNADIPYLAQGETNSKAFGRLDPKASNFAYIKDFGSARDALATESVTGSVNRSLADKAVYFKPYLLLKSADESDKPVQEMYDRIAKGGLTKDQVIRDNSVEGGGLEPRIGFFEYVADISGGALDECIQSLNKSGEIANKVVEKLGYKGDWLQFLCDTSPEWLFTIEDVAKAIGGIKLADVQNRAYMGEWVKAHPERFGVSEETVGSFVGDPEELSSVETMYDKARSVQEGATAGNVNFGASEDADEEDGDKLADALKTTGNVSHDTEGSTNYANEDAMLFNQGYNSYDSEESDGYDDNYSEEEAGDSASPEALEEAMEEALRNEEVALSVEQAEKQPLEESSKGTPHEQEVIECKEQVQNHIEEYENLISQAIALISQLSNTSKENVANTLAQKSGVPAGAVLQRMNDVAAENGTTVDKAISEKEWDFFVPRDVVLGVKEPVVEGTFVGRDPVTLPYTKSVEAEFTFEKVNGSDSEEETPLDFDLMEYITAGVFKAIGDVDNIKSIRVVGGELLVNNAKFKPNIKGVDVGRLPMDVALNFKHGYWANLFDWSTLYYMENIQSLSFDSESFFCMEVAPLLGMQSVNASNFQSQVGRFFKRMYNLKVLNIGKKCITESTVADMGLFESLAGYGAAQKTLAYSFGNSLSRSKQRRLEKRNKILHNDKISNGGKLMRLAFSGLGGLAMKPIEGIVGGINFVRGNVEENRSVNDSYDRGRRYFE